MIKKFVIGVSAWTATASGLLISKSSSSNDLVFGNYSDYISPDVAQELRKDFNLRIDLFDYDHLVKERFDKGIYDIAIVSTSVLSELKSTGAAMKLDWNELLKEDGENGTTTSNVAQKTVSDARPLFTDIVQDMSQNLLEYGIPYFVQKLSFYYRGEKISGLEDDKQISFKELVKKIAHEPRFKSNNGKPTLGLIDDPRTVLSLARKVSGNSDVNPKDQEYKKSSEILKDYEALINAGLSSDNLGKDFLYMTPDSGPLVDALVNKDIQGAFMYNGDGFFASYGGNAGEEKEPDTSDFHTVELAENIFFLDFLAFSNNMSEEKKTKAHALAKKLLFITKENQECPFKENEDASKGEKPKCPKEEDSEDCPEDESKSEEDDEETSYKEMAVRNFDDVMYTPVLKSVYEQLDKEYLGFTGSTSSEKECKSKLKSKIIKVEKSKNVSLEKEYERQLTPEQKSDMLVAYSHFKLLIK